MFCLQHVRKQPIACVCIASLMHAMWTQHTRPSSCAKLLGQFTRAVQQGPESTQFLLHSWRRHYTWRYRESGFSLSNSVALTHKYLSYLLIFVFFSDDRQIGLVLVSLRNLKNSLLKDSFFFTGHDHAHGSLVRKHWGPQHQFHLFVHTLYSTVNGLTRHLS